MAKRISPSRARFRRWQWIYAWQRAGYTVTWLEHVGRAPMVVACVKTELFLAR